MKRTNRIVALMLVLIMALSMVACGDDGKKKGNDKVDVSKVESIYDAIKLAPEYNKGEYKTEVKLDASAQGATAKLSFDASGKKDGENGTASLGMLLKVNDGEIKLNLDDVFTAADGKGYINVDSIMKTISGVDTEFGSLGIKMPKADTKKQDELNKLTGDLTAGLLEAMLKNVDVKKDGTSFSASLKDAKDYKTAAIEVLKYVDKNKDQLSKIMKTSSEVYDVKEWLKDVIDDMEDDVLDASKKLGLPLSKDQIKEVKKAIDKMDVADQTSEIDEVLDEVKLDEFVKELEGIDDAEFEKVFKELDKVQCDIKVTAEEKKFEVECVLSFEAQGNKIDLTVSSTIEIKDVTIKAPKNATTITKMVDYVMNNQDVLMKVANGAQEIAKEMQKAAKAMGSVNIGVGTSGDKVTKPAETVAPSEPVEPEETAAPEETYAPEDDDDDENVPNVPEDEDEDEDESEDDETDEVESEDDEAVEDEE